MHLAKHLDIPKQFFYCKIPSSRTASRLILLLTPVFLNCALTPQKVPACTLCFILLGMRVLFSSPSGFKKSFATHTHARIRRDTFTQLSIFVLMSLGMLLSSCCHVFNRCVAMKIAFIYCSECRLFGCWLWNLLIFLGK